jgi:hypothetical protein
MNDLDYGTHPISRLAFVLWLFVMLAAIALAWHWCEAHAPRVPHVEGYYWCSTDPRAPVHLWNTGSDSAPHWQLQHGPGDVESADASTCRFSQRIRNPFVED